MDWTIFLQVTLPMAAGFGWIITRMDKKFERVDDKFAKVDDKLGRIEDRLSRLEGAFFERGYWESRGKRLGEEE